jgi:hypothetical protein
VDLRRLRVGEWITAVAGALLLVSLFLPWYSDGGGNETSGFAALGVIDLVLAVVAVGALAFFVLTACQPLPAVPLAFNVFLVLALFPALLLVVLRVLDLPGSAETREAGVWLGLAATAGVALGGWIALRDDRRPKPGRSTDLSGRPVAPPPPVETLPAPPRDLQSRG